jgi:hypothetical protein
MKDKIRTTLFFAATACAYTLLAYLNGAKLPPKPYMIWGSIFAVHMALCLNSGRIARWIREPGIPQVDVYVTQMIFVWLVCAGTAYSMLAKLIIEDGEIVGPRDDHELSLVLLTVLVIGGWAVMHPTREFSVAVFPLQTSEARTHIRISQVSTAIEMI